jgi:hypothetical protein
LYPRVLRVWGVDGRYPIYVACFDSVVAVVGKPSTVTCFGVGIVRVGVNADKHERDRVQK